ncbi:MAG: hypothetical protein HPZ91_01650 [Lentisphaeria bacterium]|nr:hypothetical protein [Lentisphaeria bacterium]
MKKPSPKFNRGLLCSQLLLLAILGGLALLRDFHLSELAAANTVLRYAGEVIIDTQALVKLELNQAPDDRAEAEKLRKSISTLLDHLSAGNPAMRLKLLNDRDYNEELSRLYMQWKKLDSLIDVCRRSPETKIHLFMLSVEYYNQSKVTLAAAENYSVRVTGIIHWETVTGGILWGLIVLISLYLLYIKIGGRNDGPAR